MIPKECKRLAEVDFPIAAVGSAVVNREKKFPVPRGLPSTMHHWWARRPLASSRAVLLALLLPDPADKHCPQEFKGQARRTLLGMVGRPKGWKKAVASDAGLRRILLQFIADFAKWDNAANPHYLAAGRALVKAAHGGEAPLVADPFAGGGSIPLEALRLGCEAFASDLNPVACLILKTMLEDIPRHGPQLAEELRKAGAAVKEAAQEELADLYPPDPDGATPIAWLWARTVRCEAPACGAEIPLVRSLWLCKKAKRKRALRPTVSKPEDGAPRVEFEVFEPETDKDVPAGTVTRAKATCLCCSAVLPPDRVRSQLVAQRGGADAVFDDQGRRTGGARLTAVVTLKPGEKGRRYRAPTDADYAAVYRAQERLAEILEEWERGGKQGLCPVPDEPLPLMSGTFNVPLYGINRWGDLFTARQKVAFILSVRRIGDIYGSGQSINQSAAELTALALDKVADFNCSLAQWRSTNEDIGHLFGRQALPMVWDFAETDLSSESYMGLERAVNHVLQVLKHTSAAIKHAGFVQQADAINNPLPDQSAGVWFTDPPYYFAIPYADLSDFFFAWLKRTLPNHPLLCDPFAPDNRLTPKGPELCEMARWDQERYSHKDQRFFEDGMAAAFTEGRRVLREDGIATVVFAHKTTEGWEALLSGMIRGGWTITGSWPVASESSSRLRARDSAVLATSIHLICRPRPGDAPVGDWAAVLRELPRRVGAWMERLQGEGVRGADLVFACIGPALEIFSRCRAVETAEGRGVGLAEYLEKVWEVVGRTALENVLGTAETQARNGMAGALEEDARLTALFLWTLQSTDDGDDAAAEDDGEDAEAPRGKQAGYSLIFDVARRFAQPLGIHLENWEGRIVETSKGVVRLLNPAERGKQLFGEDGGGAAAAWMEREPGGNVQHVLFPEMEAASGKYTRGRGRKPILSGDAEFAASEATTLDRVHAAMLWQASGRSEALRNLLKAEQQRGPDFLRLANALSALYPAPSEEKRLLDAMLLAAPR